MDMSLFAEKAEEWFSFTYNVDKSYQTRNPKNVHFLGYYKVTGVPYKPVDTTIASAVYPERMPQDKFETAVRLVGQAYSCFEPTDANRFFRAAAILIKEMEGCDLDMIQDFTADHPHFFKYLHTIGVSTHSGLKVPKCDRWDVVMITLPHAPRKRWVPKRWDHKQLMDAANMTDDLD